MDGMIGMVSSGTREQSSMWRAWHSFAVSCQEIPSLELCNCAQIIAKTVNSIDVSPKVLGNVWLHPVFDLVKRSPPGKFHSGVWMDHH